MSFEVQGTFSSPLPPSHFFLSPTLSPRDLCTQPGTFLCTTPRFSHTQMKNTWESNCNWRKKKRKSCNYVNTCCVNTWLGASRALLQHHHSRHSQCCKKIKKKKKRKAFHGRGAQSTRETSVHWQTKQAVSDFLISQSMTHKPHSPRSLHVGCKWITRGKWSARAAR